jgi:Zn-dependent peptidase ImmA (M78 family)/DNA-binding XRE family transcriptional regulator
LFDALITGDVLRWARERRGLSYSDLAHSSHEPADDLRQWEEGDAYPPFRTAQKLARFLRIPFGYLFLSKAPSDSFPVPDFRTVKGKSPAAASPDLIDVLNHVSLKQEWYREYSEQNSIREFILSSKFKMSSGVQRVADDIRKQLSIDSEMRGSCRDWRAYLSRLSQNAQDLGILVMRSGIVGSDTTRPLDVDEFRGFALTDPVAPVVFVNARDAIAAQIFTLIHELAHIWITQSGISNPDPVEFTAVHHFEEFCNSVAANVLVPEQDFNVAWSSIADAESFPNRLARMFWVSPLVIIRRAYEFDQIGREEFSALVRREKQKSVNLERRLVEIRFGHS